jgi:hypothetical protein
MLAPACATCGHKKRRWHQSHRPRYNETNSIGNWGLLRRYSYVSMRERRKRLLTFGNNALANDVIGVTFETTLMAAGANEGSRQ